MTSNNIQSMISAVYYNYYQALCISHSTDNKQIVYGYQPSLNQPNLKVMGNDGNNYYYKGISIHFTNTNQQNIPNVSSDKNKFMAIIEHQVLTNSINGVYSKLYVVLFINNAIAQENDFTKLLSSNSNSSVNINSMLIPPNNENESATFFLDSANNSAVMVFSGYINMKVDKLTQINGDGNGTLLFNAPTNTPTCNIQIYKSLESWLQCTMVSSNDDQEVVMKSVPVNDNNNASNQSAMFILIIVIGIVVLTYATLPRIYYWLLNQKPNGVNSMKGAHIYSENEIMYFFVFGLLLSTLFIILGLISVGNNVTGLTDSMSGGFLLTGISLFLYVPFCIMIINNFRTNNSQIQSISHEYYGDLIKTPS